MLRMRSLRALALRRRPTATTVMRSLHTTSTRRLTASLVSSKPASSLSRALPVSTSHTAAAASSSSASASIAALTTPLPSSSSSSSPIAFGGGAFGLGLSGASSSAPVTTGFGSFGILSAKRRFTTIGLNGAVEALHNGILENDDYYRRGLPRSKFQLALGPITVAAESGADALQHNANAAAAALKDKLYSILSAHRDVDPFAIVENDLKQLTSSIKQVIGSDHPVLMAVAKYFFEVSGKRIRPTILLLVARALNFGLDPASGEWSKLTTATGKPLSEAEQPQLAASFKQRLYTSHTAAPSTAAAINAAIRSTPSPHAPLTPMHSPNYPNATIASAADGSAPATTSASAASGNALASQQLGTVADSQKTISEITEMIHTASLLHDDVVDHAKTRRGVSSLNAMFGNKVAILGGDFLLARASVALARLRDPYVTELLSLVIEHLVKGEIMQAKPLVLRSGRLWENVEQYLTKSYYKTASLIAHSCKAVAVLGGHDEAVQDIAYEYGKSIGLAFQVVDDLLDFESSSSALGKPANNDLAQGIVTAPVLFAAEEFPELRELMQRKFERPGDLERALDLVARSNGIERARELARSCVADAVAALLQLKPSRARSALIHLSDIVLHREK